MRNLKSFLVLEVGIALLSSCQNTSDRVHTDNQQTKLQEEYKTCIVRDIQVETTSSNESLKKGAIGAGVGLASSMLLGTKTTKSVIIGGTIGALAGGGEITHSTNYTVVLEDSIGDIHRKYYDYNPGLKPLDTVKYLPYRDKIIK